MEHLDFLTVSAMHDHFKDIAHTEYDLAGRCLAETQGFAAFEKENNRLSVTYYGAQNMCPKSSKRYTASNKRPNQYLKNWKRPCFRWNKEYGCSCSEDDCDHPHWCAKCSNKSHKRLALKIEAYAVLVLEILIPTGLV